MVRVHILVHDDGNLQRDKKEGSNLVDKKSVVISEPIYYEEPKHTGDNVEKNEYKQIKNKLESVSVEVVALEKSFKLANTP